MIHNRCAFYNKQIVKMQVAYSNSQAQCNDTLASSKEQLPCGNEFANV